MLIQERTPAPGRTTTAADGRLTQVARQLPETPALLLALVIYGVVGVILPLVLHANLLGFIGLNATAAMSGWALTFVWRPVLERNLRRQREQASHLGSLSARDFELFVGELMRRAGWDVEETGRRGTEAGTADLRLRRGPQARLVQCERWQSQPVGVDEVRKLGGVLMRDGLSGSDGILVTSSEFTPAAVSEAKQTRIELIDGRRLIRLIEEVGAPDLLGEAADTASA